LSWYFKQEYDKAFYYSSLAQETLEGIKEEQRGELANIYNTHALVSIKKNKYRKAEVYLNKALALVDRFQYPRDKNELMFNKAFLSYSQGNYDAAKAGFEKTSSYLKEKYPEDHKLIGKAQYYLGHINYNKKKYLDALEYCEASLRSFIPEYSDTLFQSTSTLYCRSLRNAARTLVLKAKVEYRIVQKMSSASTDKLKEVFQTYDTALKLFDLLRKQYHAEDSKHFLATETRELFSSVFDMCYELVSGGNSEYISQAFHFIEKAQSPILFDRADLSDITDKGGVNINLFKKESELLINDSYYKNQLAKAKSEQDSFKIKMFSNYKSRNKKALDSLKVVLKENHPNYFNYQYASRHVTLEEFQLAMPDDLGWLQYHIEEDKIYVLYITATETYFDKIVIDDKLRDHLRSFIQIFNPEEQVDLSYEKASVEEYVTPAAYIYEVLVGSYISFDKPRLALCPSGILNYIPFDGLLTTTDRDVDNFIDLPYLIEEVAINYQNSANLFYRNIHHKNTESREDMIAFAPFADIDTIYSILRADDRLALQHSKTEVENLMQLFDGRSYFGKEATKGVFIENVNACQVLHLATHGSANDTIPANAYLMFSDPKDTIQDSNLLHAYEIQNLDLKADLVVLSACDTGHGTIDEGEGPMSLARAFVYAGIPSTVMSKWKVNDLSGSKIVSAFYHQLTKGARKDIALQNAKKHYLSEEADFITAHPYYWAALSQIGNTSSLSNKSHLFGGQTTYVAFGCALFLLVGSVLFRFIKKS